MALTPLTRLGDLILIALLDSTGHRAESKSVPALFRDPEQFVPTREDSQKDGDRPGWKRWESRVYIAQRFLVAAQWLLVDRESWTLTAAGESAARTAKSRGPHDEPVTKLPDEQPLVRSSVMAAPLLNPDERAQLGFPTDETVPLPVLVELNVLYSGGVDEAFGAFTALCKTVTPRLRPPPHRLTEDFVHLRLPMERLRALVETDAQTHGEAGRSIYRIWPDFPVQPLIDASSRTVKADAARRSFSALGDGVVWAVIDSGIDQNHPHFADHKTVTSPDVVNLHRDFNESLDPDVTTARSALTDERGHGTHVAGIIAGAVRASLKGAQIRVLRDQYADAERNQPGDVTRRPYNRELLAGMAPRTRLVSLKALPPEEDSEMSRVIAALRYVRQVNAASDRLMRIHGVNISVGYEFDPQWFACGQSPLCKEVDRLVRTGVIVVVAAGNTGYGRISAKVRQTNVGISMTINDPGNAERAITVGSTHRDRPHTYGVSYFSSKGPTGDGRVKPDLLAPGERIVSCAAGAKARGVTRGAAKGTALYVEDSGTSMAAPHVSGAIAAFLSVRPEFIGQPERIKQIFCETATSLGREPYLQGAGLVDLMRALQAV